MKLNAVGVTTSNFSKTLEFYELLGFKFPDGVGDGAHIETAITDSSAKLMIDSKDMAKDIIGEDQKPGNHSSFAVQYDSAEEVNDIASKIKSAGFTIIKEPWDAFWGQRYCVVEDPDGYKVDLYAELPKNL
ncbi:MAG: VOC family protein [bacterium]|nr:VOC family protein [bacterium]